VKANHGAFPARCNGSGGATPPKTGAKTSSSHKANKKKQK
jgi:hypothetical protein